MININLHDLKLIIQVIMAIASAILNLIGKKNVDKIEP